MKSIQAPRVENFTRRITPPPALGTQRLETVLIAPAYQERPAFDSRGLPLPEAQISWVGESGADTDQYRSGLANAFGVFADAPGLRAGAVVDPLSISMVSQIGAGPARVEKQLYGPSNERVAFTRTSGISISTFGGEEEAGIFYRKLTVAGVEWGQVLARAAAPGVVEKATIGTAFPRPLSEETTSVRITLADNTSYTFLVVAYDEDDPTALLLQESLEYPAAISNIVRVDLVLRARNYQTLPQGGRAQALVGRVNTWPEATLGEDADGNELYLTNLSTYPIEVEYSDDTLGVTVTPDSTLKVELAYEAGDDKEVIQGVLDDALGRYFDGHSPLWVYGTDEDLNTELPSNGDLLISTASAYLMGTLRARSVGSELNGLQVSISVASGNDTPASFTEIAPGQWELLLSTDNSGDPSLTFEGLATLLDNESAPLEFVYGPHPGVTVINYASEPRNLRGLDTQAWRRQEALVDANSASFGITLRGGTTLQGIEIFGGQFPSLRLDPIPSAQFYMSYRALRRDLSPKATIATTGNRPGLLELTESSYEIELGPPSLTNPASLAAAVYLQQSGNRRVFLLSPHEVSPEEPWGTREAMTQTLDFTLKRDVVHVVALNDAYWMPQLAADFCRSLQGEITPGTMPEPLKKALRLYIPTKNPTTEPDFSLVSGINADFDSGADTVQASCDFLSAGVQVGDVLVAESAPLAGNILLQNGQRGWEVTDVGTGGDPYTVQIAGGAVAITGSAVTVYRRGTSLALPDGTYDTDRATPIIVQWQTLFRHPRLAKHHVDRWESVVAGRTLSMDGVYGLAHFMGVYATKAQNLPMSDNAYPNARRVEGTSDLFTEEQLSFLTGAGLILPIQTSAGGGTVKVRRDVSSDTTTQDFQFRGAGVAEDMLTIAIERTARRRLGPSVVNQELLDNLSVDLDAVLTQFRSPPVFRELEITRIVPLTPEVREQLGIDDTGVLIERRIRHFEEAAVAVSYQIVDSN